MSKNCHIKKSEGQNLFSKMGNQKPGTFAVLTGEQKKSLSNYLKENTSYFKQSNAENEHALQLSMPESETSTESLLSDGLSDWEDSFSTITFGQNGPTSLFLPPESKPTNRNDSGFRSLPEEYKKPNNELKSLKCNAISEDEIKKNTQD